MDIRVRHSKGKRRATLVTIREGDVVYFGIARCNSQAGDIFCKAHGRRIAEGRAYVEMEEVNEGRLILSSDTGLSLHELGLRGHCDIKDVKNLLGYFETIHVHQFSILGKAIDRLQELAGIVEYENCDGCDRSCEDCCENCGCGECEGGR